MNRTTHRGTLCRPQPCPGSSSASARLSSCCCVTGCRPFVPQAAGCDEDLTPEDVDSGDMDELVQQLTDKVIQVSAATWICCLLRSRVTRHFPGVQDMLLRLQSGTLVACGAHSHQSLMCHPCQPLTHTCCAWCRRRAAPTPSAAAPSATSALGSARCGTRRCGGCMLRTSCLTSTCWTGSPAWSLRSTREAEGWGWGLRGGSAGDRGRGGGGSVDTEGRRVGYVRLRSGVGGCER